MAELHRYPLRVQQSKLDGWWFIFVDGVPGFGVLGPNYEDLLERLKVMASKLFLERGEAASNIEIVRSDKLALQVFH
jgi:predicted RNase H-like HicB family nuclease